MHMRFDTADFMNVDAGRIDAAAAQVMMNDGFDFGNEQWGTFFGMPGHVQIDFGVIVAGHRWAPDAKAEQREAP
jgi:hypothetical protein